jgi:hypothetical protein
MVGPPAARPPARLLPGPDAAAALLPTGPEPQGSVFRYEVTLTNTGASACTELLCASWTPLDWGAAGDVLSSTLTRLAVPAIAPGEARTFRLTALAAGERPEVFLSYNSRLARFALPVRAPRRGGGLTSRRDADPARPGGAGAVPPGRVPDPAGGVAGG